MKMVTRMLTIKKVWDSHITDVEEVDTVCKSHSISIYLS